MDNWYKQPLGQSLLHAETKELNNIISKIFGYYLLQLGGPNDGNKYLKTSLVHHHIRLVPVLPQTKSTDDVYTIQGNYEELPFINNSIDVAVLLHSLELSDDPQLILKALYDALIPGGHLVISTFNPNSLWGITHAWKNHNRLPWSGKFIAPKLIKQWLTDLGFTISVYKTIYFRPPIENKTWLKKISFIETLGRIFLPFFGGSCIYVAHKTVATITPIAYKSSHHQPIAVTNN